MPTIKREIELLISRYGENNSQIMASVLENELKSRAIPNSNNEKLHDKLELDEEKIKRAILYIRMQMIIDNSVAFSDYLFEDSYGYQGLCTLFKKMIEDDEMVKEISLFLLADDKIIRREVLEIEMENRIKSLETSIDEKDKLRLKLRLKNRINEIINRLAELDNTDSGLVSINSFISELRLHDIIEAPIEENWLFSHMIKHQSLKGSINYKRYLKKLGMNLENEAKVNKSLRKFDVESSINESL